MTKDVSQLFALKRSMLKHGHTERCASKDAVFLTRAKEVFLEQDRF